jgi:hypothetical protein
MNQGYYCPPRYTHYNNYYQHGNYYGHGYYGGYDQNRYYY